MDDTLVVSCVVPVHSVERLEVLVLSQYACRYRFLRHVVLPAQIRDQCACCPLRRVVDVGPSFHSSHSAISKRYAYFLAVGETRPVLATGRLAWERRAQLDLASLRAQPQRLGTRL